MIWCVKTYIIAYVKTQKIRFIIHYVKPTAHLMPISQIWTHVYLDCDVVDKWARWISGWKMMCIFGKIVFEQHTMMYYFKQNEISNHWWSILFHNENKVSTCIIEPVINSIKVFTHKQCAMFYV